MDAFRALSRRTAPIASDETRFNKIKGLLFELTMNPEVVITTTMDNGAL
jgi:hypothetical protein